MPAQVISGVVGVGIRFAAARGFIEFHRQFFDTCQALIEAIKHFSQFAHVLSELVLAVLREEHGFFHALQTVVARLPRRFIHRDTLRFQSYSRRSCVEQFFRTLPVVCLAIASSAFGQEGQPAQVDLTAAATGKQTQSQYTNADTGWWTFGVGASSDFDAISDINVMANYEYFVTEDVSVIGEVAIRDFDIPGDDVQAINPAIVFRWHFWSSDDNDWTVFGDIGIGIMLSTDDVPQDGTSVNFTPRVGVGVTKAISDSWRLQAGVRWSHISNGRIFGDDDNPSSDGAMAYIGFTTSF